MAGGWWPMLADNSKGWIVEDRHRKCRMSVVGEPRLTNGQKQEVATWPKEFWEKRLE